MNDSEIERRERAEQLHVQAQLRLIRIQAYIKVYFFRDSSVKQLTRDGLEFIDAALEIFPDSPKYLNTKALFLADGYGDKEGALALLKRAAELSPDDIQIRQNIRSLTTDSGCLSALMVGGILTLAGYAFIRFHYT